MIFDLIGAAFGYGAQIQACEGGPKALLQNGILKALKEIYQIGDVEILTPSHTAKEILPLLVGYTHYLAQRVEFSLREKRFPLVIGGDHSVAIGTWNGVKQANPDQPLGLIWIDAHMDCHTPETTPSGAWHGMPLAVLLGEGADEITHKRAVIQPHHLCLVGIRSYEKEEVELLNKLGAQVFDMEAVKQQGLKNVLQKAIDIVSKAEGGFGVSLDLDVFDPTIAPGIGSPEEGGLMEEEISALSLLQNNPRLKALEIVEYNPVLDRDRKTAELTLRIIKEILGNHHE